MKKTLILYAVMIFTALGVCASQVSDSDIAEKFRSSLVRVEYTLRYDRADSPEVTGWGQRCPSCGEYHCLDDGGELVRQERPLEIAGLVLAADRVLTADVMIHPRFVENIAVRFGDQLVNAQIVSYALDYSAVVLKLEKPLQRARPVEFVKSSARPFKIVSYSELNGLWMVGIDKFNETYISREDGRSFISAPEEGLIVDANGLSLGIAVGQEFPLDDSWQQSPQNWPVISKQQMDQKLADLETHAGHSLLRVKLTFRSPKKSEQAVLSGSSLDEDEDSATEMNIAAVVIDPNHILIVSKLKPKATGRLERILVFPVKGMPIEASFEGTLSNYGGLIAVLDKPLPDAPVVMSTEPIVAFDKKMLLYAELRIQGENRTVYFGHSRIASFSLGWRRQIQPSLALMDQDKYLFDMDGKLVALPLTRREKIASEEDRWVSDSSANLMACCYLNPALRALKDNYDPGNIPLSEEEENRIAWLGVELQSLDSELARINKVSDLTRDGEIGAMVSYVYENSPASVSGIELGDILLRLHVENQPKPMDVLLTDSGGDYMEMFPWDQLSEMPEEYYDQLPTPWPSAENTFMRSVSDLGFGTKCQIELFRGGKVLMKNLVVTQSPPHYASAKRFKSESLGLTVRNLTYEVRRYFRLTGDNPGVIVSRLEPGGKAGVSGIKPYEIITHINDAPVANVDDFDKLIAADGELKLSIKRMTKGRVVILKMDSTPLPSQDEPAGPDEKESSGDLVIENQMQEK